LTPIEPFKLFHKINQNVNLQLQRNQPRLREQMMAQAEMVSVPGGRSTRPAGIAQLGYACFWPNGGGLNEGASEQQQQPQQHQQLAPPEQQPQQEHQPRDSQTDQENEPQSNLVEVDGVGDGSES
jgi:hypothetical protein